jgi:hypothetical protein
VFEWVAAAAAAGEAGGEHHAVVGQRRGGNPKQGNGCAEGREHDPAASRDPDTHCRVRHDRIDDSGVVTLRHAGRLHHIGLGRTHARTHVIVLVQDLDIRVVNAATGELLRELKLNPDIDYQPQDKGRKR